MKIKLHRTYKVGKFNSAGISITLDAETKSFNAKNYSEIETSDGSAAVTIH